MRAAQIENGAVVNYAEVSSFDGHMFIDPLDSVISSTWDGAKYTHPPAPVPEVPEEISPRQFRQALNKFGFRQQVDGAVAASNDQDLKDWYEWSTEFQRHHPEVLAMASALGFTSDQLDQVWIYGATL